MKLTSEQEQQLNLVYETYWAQYLKGNVQAMEVLLDESYTQVGSAESEVFTTKKQAVQFLKDTIDEVAGKLEMRNRSIQKEQQDAIVIVHERCDLYVFDGQQWVFYSKFRATTLLTERKDGWKIIHQHSSFPDSKTEEGQNVAIDKIAEENRELREAVKRRTVELEQKNKELAVEASLERVRARAMAMQNSDELSELVDTVFKELTKLDLALSWCMINIIDEPSMSNMVWGANPEIGKAPESYHMLFEDYRFHHEMFRAWKEKKDKWVFVLKGNEKETYDDYLFTQTEFRRVPKPVQKEMRATKQYVASFTFSNFGGLQTVGEEPLSDESLDILSRFGKVFDLTYTRFNDLKQAEAQAREAQIEASLERVRSRSMAMYEANELADTAMLLFEQVTELGIVLRSCGFLIMDDEHEIMEDWSANVDEHGKSTIVTGTLGFNQHPLISEVAETWRKGEPYFIGGIHGKDLQKYYKAVTSQESISKAVKRKVLTKVTSEYTNSFYFEYGMMYVLTPEPITDHEINVLIRFAKVFKLTYRRFLDIQKAEAQAREAQIETALERIRARALAMHTSEELIDVANVLREQMGMLGQPELEASVIELYEVDDQLIESWYSFRPVSNLAGNIISGTSYFPKGACLLLSEMLEMYHSSLNEYTLTASGEKLEEWINVLIQGSPEIVQYMNQEDSTPETMYYHFSDFSGGSLCMTSGIEPSNEAKNLQRRAASVFDLAYRRFLDLQKAEAQAREAQIEAALERVRSKTMAMHNSQEVGETVVTLFDEVMKLGIDQSIRCGIGILEGNERMETWSANYSPSGKIDLKTGMLNMTIHPMLVGLKKAWKSKKKSYSYDFIGKDVIKYYTALNKEPEYPFNADLKTLPDKVYHNSFFYSSGILFAFTENPISKEGAKVLNRFAKVFGQTYRRYLDLQKAEEQAREATIESALERVRASSMAMHRSEDLPETAEVLFEQFALLGNIPDRMSIGIYKEEKNLLDLWVTDQIGGQLNHRYVLKMDEATTVSKTYKAWKEGKDSVVIDLSGQSLKKWLNYIKQQVKLPIDLSNIKGRRVQQAAFFSEGFLLFTTNEPVADEIMQLLIRFARVFDQTYRRFLDLQKAEAQAREAQIEAALERVRAASMAMHKTDELAQVVLVLFQQFSELELDFYQVWINIFFIEEGYSNCWFSPVEGVIEEVYTARIPLAPFEESSIMSWRAGEEFSYLSWRGLKEVDEISKSLSEMTGHESFIRIQKKKRMDRMEIVDSNHKYGVLAMAKNNDITDNDRIILKRFSKVFEQTYTRFLDLQNAEAQAREAQIEVALERVRSRAMAMHHTDELTDVLGVLFDQFDFLGINPVLTHLTLFDEANETFTLRITTGGKNRVIAEQLIDVNAVESWKTSFDNWKKSDLHAVDCIDYPPEILPAVWELLDEVMSALPEEHKIVPEDFPNGFYTTQGHCKYGFIGFNHSRRATEEEKDIVVRFAKEFGRLYQRFLDLQQAEKRAKDALKQASLDRVRGQIASMRTAADLERITPLVWNELKVLGVPFIRCGVFIIDEKTKMVEVYLSAPDGHSLGVLHLQFRANTLIANMVANWRKGNIFKEHWNREEFISWTGSLMQEGQISDKSTYQGAANPPESLNLHFIPFTQGMLYVGSEDPLNNEQIELVQSLAEAFSIAYARYEDFTKLEKAKLSVETTLSELKATQTQLVQSEKMASLGELTAGIAHEIQNPLNFVNNFSEVSAELIEEMHEELQKGDLKEALAIAEDVKQNLDKITHHGKRADGIVKGMLQHSRSSSGQKEPTDINVLADEYLRLAYHGLRAKDKTFNATIKTDFDERMVTINVISQDIGRVILNLITNAFYAVSERKKQQPNGFEPTVSVSTKKKGDQIFISVKDNGNGIPDSALKKIFQPFFTTKPTGQGTGLGLSLSYDIVKAHGGELRVETKEGQGTTFKVQLPMV